MCADVCRTAADLQRWRTMAYYERTDTPGKFRVRTSLGTGHDRRTKAATLQSTTRKIDAEMAEWERKVHAAWGVADTGPGDSLDAVWGEYIAANPRWSESHRAGHEHNRHQVALDGLGDHGRQRHPPRRHRGAPRPLPRHPQSQRRDPFDPLDRGSPQGHPLRDDLRLDEGRIDRDPTRKIEVPKGRFIEETRHPHPRNPRRPHRRRLCPTRRAAPTEPGPAPSSSPASSASRSSPGCAARRSWASATATSPSPTTSRSRSG